MNIEIITYIIQGFIILFSNPAILDSIVVSIPTCHAGDRGSIPRRGEAKFYTKIIILNFRRWLGLYHQSFD